MLDIVRGKPEDTVQYAEELLAADPSDQESLFNLAVAQAQLGELDLQARSHGDLSHRDYR